MAESETNEPAAEAVREAVTEDAEALHALMGELADALGDRSPRFGAMRAQLEKLLAEPGARVLVVEGAEDLVGAASMWIKPDLAHGDVVIEVPMLVVSGNARRRGVGQLLVKEIRRIAAEENAALIELVATKENDVARAFYKSLGFIETEHIALEFVGDMEQPPDPKE
ncbi:MAG TPA: GNAT family N-acetyltransferase [Rubrobacteraceae bacterium]|nr:GNAT family N-acetyltransferase [Rubrobacteraceae bacterium]